MLKKILETVSCSNLENLAFVKGSRHTTTITCNVSLFCVRKKSLTYEHSRKYPHLEFEQADAQKQVLV